MKDFYYYTGLVVITTIGFIGSLIILWYVYKWVLDMMAKQFKTFWMMAEYGYYRKEFKAFVKDKKVLFPKGAGFDTENTSMKGYSWLTEKIHLYNQETLQDYLDNHLPSEFKIVCHNSLYCEILNTKTNKVFSVNVVENNESFNKNVHAVTFEFLHYVH